MPLPKPSIPARNELGEEAGGGGGNAGGSKTGAGGGGAAAAAADEAESEGASPDEAAAEGAAADTAGGFATGRNFPFPKPSMPARKEPGAAGGVDGGGNAAAGGEVGAATTGGGGGGGDKGNAAGASTGTRAASVDSNPPDRNAGDSGASRTSGAGSGGFTERSLFLPKFSMPARNDISSPGLFRGRESTSTKTPTRAREHHLKVKTRAIPSRGATIPKCYFAASLMQLAGSQRGEHPAHADLAHAHGILRAPSLPSQPCAPLSYSWQCCSRIARGACLSCCIAEIPPSC